MVWVGNDLKGHLLPIPFATEMDTFHWIRSLKAPYNLALNTLRDGESITSLLESMVDQSLELKEKWGSNRLEDKEII